MIQWLVESIEAHPCLKYGLAPEGMLAKEEIAQMEELRNSKRRREWLLGRWTMKKLLIEALRPVRRRTYGMNQIAIQHGPLGAPYAILLQNRTESPFHISISHSWRYAFCALLEKQDGWIGADIEHVERRSKGFAEEYFSDTELEILKQASRQEYELYVNAIWSAKEATLKALRLGLRLDTRQVTCRLFRVQPAQDEWLSFDIDLELQELDPTLPVRPIYPTSLVGWWRPYHNYVLSLAVYRPGPMLEKPMAHMILSEKAHPPEELDLGKSQWTGGLPPVRSKHA